jgi:hypothetical protein
LPKSTEENHENLRQSSWSPQQDSKLRHPTYTGGGLTTHPQHSVIADLIFVLIYWISKNILNCTSKENMTKEFILIKKPDQLILQANGAFSEKGMISLSIRHFILQSAAIQFVS